MSPATGWLMLVGAGLLDVGWALATKEAQGFSRPGWSLASLVLLAGFVLLIGRAMRVVDVGVAYTVATGIGIVGTLLAGVLLFGEAAGPLKLLGIVLVLAGIAALKLGPG